MMAVALRLPPAERVRLTKPEPDGRKATEIVHQPWGWMTSICTTQVKSAGRSSANGGPPVLTPLISMPLSVVLTTRNVLVVELPTGREP
jgi:hypothetical protein